VNRRTIRRHAQEIAGAVPVSISLGNSPFFAGARYFNARNFPAIGKLHHSLVKTYDINQ
jgi:hypothetical protein